MAKRSLGLINRFEQPFLRNHSLRSFLFARASASRQALRADHDYDAELVFLICVLHDLGLSDRPTGDLRFEVAGADLAAEFLEQNKASDAVIDTVWWAIAAHTNPQLAQSSVLQRRARETHIAWVGIGIDLDGPDALPAGYADRVHALYPRLGGGRTLFATIEQQAVANPLKAPPATLPGEIVHQRHPSRPYLTLDEVLNLNQWGD